MWSQKLKIPSNQSNQSNRKENAKIAAMATLFLIGLALLTLGIEVLIQMNSWIVEAILIIGVLAIIWGILFTFVKYWRIQSRELRALNRDDDGD